jgi:regulator of sirC expression with transglutaminase-like and TPR domain
MRSACVLLGWIGVFAVPPAAAQPPDAPNIPHTTTPLDASAPSAVELAQRVRRLASLLDDDRFATRQAAHVELLELGESALPHLLPIPRTASLERRERQRVLVAAIHGKFLEQQFLELAATEVDADLDLDRAMWLIARIVDPTVQQARLNAQLDQLAQRVRRKLGEATPPASAPPRQLLEAFRRALFVDFRLSGSVANYDHPDNSSLDRVLKRRVGLPILLSHVMISVAERLDVPLVGLPIPGRYMVKYDGQRAPPGFSREDIVIDAFGQGEIVSLQQLRQRIAGFDPDRHLQASSRRATVARMLRNLVSDFAAVGAIDQANRTQRYLNIMEADIASPR